MDTVMMKLPLRLVPRKGGAVFLCLFFLFFFGFSIFWTAMATTAVLSGGMVDEPFPGFRFAFPAFGIPFLLVGFFGLAIAVLKLLPGSPYYHVDISSQGLTVRRAWTIKQFAWPEISPFGVSVKTRSTKNGRRTTHWVVALRASDESRLTVETERYSRSVVQIDAGEYGRDAENAAAVLADWLNGIRAEAVERPGRNVDSTAVPPDFRGNTLEIAAVSGRMTSAASPARPPSVIER